MSRTLVFLAALSLLVAACGGDDKPQSSPTASAMTATTPASTASQGGSSASPAALPDLFSPAAVWPTRGTDDLWKDACGVPAYQVREGDPCVYTAMQRGGASREAIDFVRRYGYFLAEFDEKGKVDYGVGSAPWINMGRPTYLLALNGSPALQELGALIPQYWNKDPQYADVVRRDPTAFPWPEYGKLENTRPGANGATVWTMTFRLAPCRACPDTAQLAMDIEWTKDGALGKVTLLPPR